MQIGSNIASLGAQRQLGKATQALNRSFERLSSGLRINHAADDAAGLAVSAKLNADTRISGVAIRNISDAVSVTSIMSGAVNEQQTVITRMAELAEQSANGTLGYKQRKSLQSEYSALLAEYERIGSTTSFNGTQLLGDTTGGTSTILFQAGLNGQSDSQLSLSTVSTTTTGGVVGMLGDATGNGSYSGTDFSRIAQFLNGAMPAGFTEMPTVESVPRLMKTTIQQQTLTASNGQKKDVFAVLVPHASIAVGLFTSTDIFYMADDGNGNLSNITQQGSVSYGTIASKNLTFSDGSNADISVDLRNVNVKYTDSFVAPQNALADRTALNFSGVQSATQALYSLDILKNKIASLGQVSGIIGAISSRLEVASSVLSVQRENFAAAGAQITDVDVAEEAANLTRTQILQQASAAVLAQANQQPALALTLLRA